MKNRFLIVFGYPFEDSALDCTPANVAANKPKVILGVLDCDSLDKDAVSSLIRPKNSTENQFLRFKQNCSLLKSYDSLITWFKDKKEETNLLKDDLAAKADPTILKRLEEIHSKLSN